MNPREKFKMNKFGKNCYFLGQDEDGINYFLSEATWDCDWYWGGGYVRTYNNNDNPAASNDIQSHSHFDTMFFNRYKNGRDAFKDFFKTHPFTDDEIWKICELMQSFYIAREYAEMLHIGGAHYTSNPAKDVIQNDEEYKRINEKVIPAVMEELYKLLTP